jgi:hypothetical protein
MSPAASGLLDTLLSPVHDAADSGQIAERLADRRASLAPVIRLELVQAGQVSLQPSAIFGRHLLRLRGVVDHAVLVSSRTTSPRRLRALYETMQCERGV